MPLKTEIVTATKQLQFAVANATAKGVAKAVPDLSKLGQQQAGGVLRTLAAATMQEFGNVAGQAGRLNYERIRADVITAPYRAKAVSVNVEANLDAVVGRGMSLVQQERYSDAASAVEAAIAGLASDAFRETMAANTYDDSQATGFQRVASPNACAFCATVALNEFTSFPDSGGYHDHCGCTTIPIFRGLGSFRPSYYDDFEQDYTDALRFMGTEDYQAPDLSGSQNKSASKVLSAVRQVSGRK